MSILRLISAAIKGGATRNQPLCKRANALLGLESGLVAAAPRLASIASSTGTWDKRVSNALQTTNLAPNGSPMAYTSPAVTATKNAQSAAQPYISGAADIGKAYGAMHAVADVAKALPAAHSAPTVAAGAATALAPAVTFAVEKAIAPAAVATYAAQSAMMLNKNYRDSAVAAQNSAAENGSIPSAIQSISNPAAGIYSLGKSVGDLYNSSVAAAQAQAATPSQQSIATQQYRTQRLNAERAKLSPQGYDNVPPAEKRQVNYQARINAGVAPAPGRGAPSWFTGAPAAPTNSSVGEPMMAYR